MNFNIGDRVTIESRFADNYGDREGIVFLKEGPREGIFVVFPNLTVGCSNFRTYNFDDLATLRDIHRNKRFSLEYVKELKTIYPNGSYRYFKEEYEEGIRLNNEMTLDELVMKLNNDL